MGKSWVERMAGSKETRLAFQKVYTLAGQLERHWAELMDEKTAGYSGNYSGNQMAEKRAFESGYLLVVMWAERTAAESESYLETRLVELTDARMVAKLADSSELKKENKKVKN
jgi:hypothetical protein